MRQHAQTVLGAETGLPRLAHQPGFGRFVHHVVHQGFFRQLVKIEIRQGRFIGCGESCTRSIDDQPDFRPGHLAQGDSRYRRFRVFRRPCLCQFLGPGVGPVHNVDVSLQQHYTGIDGRPGRAACPEDNYTSV
ncbi:hypothetical protein ACFSC4_03230 [Deinococcus malanensis]|uniref:hypothetical protein n=1 Tax=Deinococcus malanensis TaxID=1706855 RepID=UPI003636E447